MQVGILGYGKEGKSAEQYFQKRGAKVEIIDDFDPKDLNGRDFNDFDLILRSPSVPPQQNFSSMTKYFFDHCPCPIIGVTGTKGKGTTCSLITDLFKALDQKVWLVGNIGNPALDVLDDISPNDAVVYEMSSFQLWDLNVSPKIAVILGIEPDHLNVHKDFTDYVQAKANIVKHQTATDVCIYYSKNPHSLQIAQLSSAQKLAYPLKNTELAKVLPHLNIPGKHNQDNAEAALLAVSSFYHIELTNFIKKYSQKIITTFAKFQGLPHRLQYLRTLNQVKYFDDNFSTTPTSLEVALKAFPEQPIVLIAGGRDKTSNQDLPEIANYIQSTSNLKKTILIGESGKELIKLLEHAELADSLPNALLKARASAEQLSQPAIVLMSPAAASFDMFDNVYARGAEFQKLVQELV